MSKDIPPRLLSRTQADSTKSSINPVVWGVFILSVLTFLITLGAANISLSWLSPVELNNIATKSIPWPFQVNDAMRDVVIPIVLFAVLLTAIKLCPRNRYTIAFANGTLIFVATRYIIWRLLTINTAHALSFTMSMAIYLYEFLFVVVLYAEFIPSTSYNPIKRKREADRLMMEISNSGQAASVDIFIATYNESVRQVRRCIHACKSQLYSNKQIYVLDDGNRDQIKQLANELNVGYITRNDNKHRKAGNLNNALGQTNGQFILVLDCDFIPFQTLISRTLGFFTDNDTAIVQTPQHYFMPDFHARNLGVEALMPSDVDMFYNYQQVIRDNYNSVICVGTSYLVRRTALESIGGYVTTCIIEDHQTGTRLLTEGWKIIYLNEILSVGETPGNLRDYIDQRLRWLQGNLQILLPSSRLPIFNSKTTSWQRIFYLLHYAGNFMPVGRAFFIFIPLFSLYLGNQLIIAPVDAYISYALPFILLLHTIPAWCSGNHTHQIWSEVYETITCIPWTSRLVKILRNPFKIYGSTVTPKDSKNNLKQLDWPLARHLVVYIVLFFLFYILRFGAPIVLPSFMAYPVNSEGQEIMILWTIYNFSVVFVALLCCIEKPFRRSSERFISDYIVRLTTPFQELTCWGVTREISETGASIAVTSEDIDLGKFAESHDIEVNLIDHDLALNGRAVRLTRDENSLPYLSVMFDHLSEPQESQLLQIIYNPTNRFLQTRVISAAGSILLYIKSVFRGGSLLQSFKS
jgi:cellulose synthase (UDP-forming)